MSIWYEVKKIPHEITNFLTWLQTFVKPLFNCTIELHFYQTLLLWAKFDFDNGNFFEDFAQCVGAFSAYLYYVDSRAKHVCSEQQLTAVQFSHFVVK